MRAYAVLAVVGVTCRVVEAVMCDVGLYVVKGASLRQSLPFTYSPPLVGPAVSLTCEVHSRPQLFRRCPGRWRLAFALAVVARNSVMRSLGLRRYCYAMTPSRSKGASEGQIRVGISGCAETSFDSVLNQ